MRIAIGGWVRDRISPIGRMGSVGCREGSRKTPTPNESVSKTLHERGKGPGDGPFLCLQIPNASPFPA